MRNKARTREKRRANFRLASDQNFAPLWQHTVVRETRALHTPHEGNGPASIGLDNEGKHVLYVYTSSVFICTLCHAEREGQERATMLRDEPRHGACCLLAFELNQTAGIATQAEMGKRNYF